MTVLFLLGHNYLNLASLQKHQKILLCFVQLHKIWSVVIYAGIYIAVMSLCLPVSILMTLTGGFLFGELLGICTAVTAATVGVTLFFVSVKMAAKDLLAKRPKGLVKKMQVEFQANAFSYLLTLRLVPLFPFVAVNLVAALLQIPLCTFFWGTLIGIIPESFVYVSIGVAMRNVVA